jgi:hypothetical protein
MHIDVAVFVDYTDWERQKWHSWLQQHPEALKISMGANCDTRYQRAGDLIRHIFVAEKRAVDGLCYRPLMNPDGIPNDDVEAMFTFGQRSREDLNNFVASLPERDWDTMKDLQFPGGVLRATPKKIIAHVLTHEMRHWGQLAMLSRQNGFKGEFHDLLFSPILGGELRREPVKVSN